VNVPEPVVLHIPPPDTLTKPDNVTELPEHIAWLAPALAFGAGEKCITIVSETGAHECVDVSTNVIVFAVVSAEVNLYVAFSVESFGEKLPVPVVLHTAVPLETFPLSTNAVSLAHIVVSFPALTTGAGITWISKVSETEPQRPL
jgi:hypothetical protein